MTDQNIDTPRPSVLLGSDAPNGSNRPSMGGGEGVDRKVEKKTWTPRRIALVAGTVALVALIAWALWSTTGGRRLNVDADKLTISTVEYAPFQEYILVTGNVLPRTTIYLDAVEGGRVEEIMVREGAVVDEGEPILRLSNNDLQLRLINAEMQRIEQLNRLQDTRLSLEQNTLNLRQQLSEMNYQIQRLQREHERNEELHEKQLISDLEYERVRDEYQYWRQQKELTMQAYRQDSLRQAREISRMEGSVARVDESYRVMESILENLVLRAPIAGQLSALNVELGELHSSGSRLGQIDVMDDYKVRAGIDEFYISRVTPGQLASGEVGGQSYRLRVWRVYPEVRDGRFEVDFEFVDDPPEGIRRGQTLRFRLEMSDSAEATILSQGGFYQTTGGNWVYVVNGDEAVKRSIRLGRKNNQYFEVLDGLQAGDRVVTSSYDTFGDADRLVLD